MTLFFSLLSAFKMACDTNRVVEGAALWILHFFKKRPSASALNAHITLKMNLYKRQKRITGTSNFEAINYLFVTYASKDVIAKTDADMMPLTQSSNKSNMEYADTL